MYGLSVVCVVFALLAAAYGGYISEPEAELYEFRLVNATTPGQVREEVRMDKQQSLVIIDSYTSPEAIRPEYSFILDIAQRNMLVVLHDMELCFLYSVTEEDVDKGYFLPQDAEFQGNHDFAQMMKVKVLHNLAESDWISSTEPLDQNKVDPMVKNQCVDFNLLRLERDIQEHDGFGLAEHRVRRSAFQIDLECCCCCCCCCCCGNSCHVSSSSAAISYGSALPRA